MCVRHVLQNDSCFSAAMCYFVFKWKSPVEIGVTNGLSENVRMQLTAREKQTNDNE